MPVVATNLRGTCRVEIYLAEVTETRVEAVLDEIADVLVANKVANSKESNANLTALIVVSPARFPGLNWRFKRKLKRASVVVIPKNDHDG